MTSEARFGWRTGASVGVVAIAVLIGMIGLSLGSDNGDPKPGPSKPVMTDLEFAAWGSDVEIGAYQAIVNDYNASSTDTKVALSSWPDASAMLADVRDGKAKPDLYLLPRTELEQVIDEERNLPLGDLLTAREIPIGDDFQRDAVQAFSIDDALQCMPYTVSPMVIYYNKSLVDFEAMDEAGLPTPNPEHTGWNLGEFRAAAEFASRPRQRTRGVHIEPTLEGLAPFVLSGGGKLFNNAAEPTSLALGEDDGLDNFKRTLELLRDPLLTLSSRQLEQRPALEWFKRGRLGMIAGYRNLTPELRAVDGLKFDVMPMPNLGAKQTIGEHAGLCITPGRGLRVEAAANFLTYLVSDEAVARIASTGYVEPAKLTVALQPDFTQPNQQPEHAHVFTDTLRWIVAPPLLKQRAELEELVNPDILALLRTPVLDDLKASLQAIDEKSRSLLDPEYEPVDPDESDGASDQPSVPSVSSDPSDSATDDRKRD